MEAPECVVDTSSKLQEESCTPAKCHQKSCPLLPTKVTPSKHRKPLKERPPPVEQQADTSLSDAALCHDAAMNTDWNVDHKVEEAKRTDFFGS
jgi:hypothetical protein